ncbi:MAG: hypothetical protein ABIQ02_16355 [Saprospiraceae bacterium]
MFFLLPFLWFFSNTNQTITPDLVSATYTNIIMASTDGGTIWRDVSKGLPAENKAFTLEFIDDQLYVGNSGGLYTSPNEEAPKWKKENSSPEGILGIFPGKNGKYAVTLQNELFQQQRAGSWEPLKKNMKDQRVNVVHETADDGLLATSENAIYKTSDQGQSWKHVLTARYINSLIENNHVYVATALDGVWRSTNEGENWTHVLTTPTFATSITPFQNGFLVVVLGQEFGGIVSSNEIYLSGDDGVSWKTMEIPSELKGVYQVKSVGKFLIACSEEGIFRSPDQGKTWQKIHDAPDNRNNFYKIVSSGSSIFAIRLDGC